MPAAPAPSAPPPALIAALKRLLRPLARLLLAQGVGYPHCAELLKAVYVEVADGEFRLPGKAQTDSRVSLLSGVHRKDVRRLRSAPPGGGETVPAAVSLGAQLAARWVATPRYLDRHGRPLPLPRYASEGGEKSFEALVASVSTDIRARAVLDEWLRLGVVHCDDEDRVCLNVDAFVPQRGFEEKAFYLGHNVHDHLAAAAANLQGAQPAFLERSVHYDALGPASIADLAGTARTLGMDALKTVNRKAMELERRDARGAEPRQRMTFGTYFYSEPAAVVAPARDNP